MKKADILRLLNGCKKVANEAQAELIQRMAEPDISMEQARKAYQEAKARVQTEVQETKQKLAGGYSEAIEYIRTYVQINRDRSIRQSIVADLEELIKTAKADCHPEELYPLPNLTLNDAHPVTLMQALYNTTENKHKQGGTQGRGRKADQRSLKEVIVQGIIKGRGHLLLEYHDLREVLQIWDDVVFDATKRVARLRLGAEKRKADPQEQVEYIINTLKSYGEIPSYNILKKDLPSIAPATTFYRYLRRYKAENNGSE